MPRPKLLTYHGRTRSQTAWAKRRGIAPRTFNYRLTHDWSITQALTVALDEHRLAPRPCLWCPVHEVAWCAAPLEGAPYWHPLPRGMLQLALTLAKAAHCSTQIQVQCVPCDRCDKEASLGKDGGLPALKISHAAGAATGSRCTR
jgi:hypothetical protein